MLREISHEELLEWATFDALEPDEGTRNEYRLAALMQFMETLFEGLAHTVVNVATGKQPQRREAKKLEKYLLRFGDDAPQVTRKQSWQDQWAMLKSALGVYVDQRPERKTKVARPPKKPQQDAAPRRSLRDRRGGR